VLKAACEGRLVAQDPNDEPASELLARILTERRRQWEASGKKGRYQEPVGVDGDAAGLPELPVGWVWATLPQLGELARGKSKHRPRNAPHLYGGRYPFIQTGEVRAAEGYITSYTQTYSAAGLAQSRIWPKGTLCITIAANIADTAILGFDACFPDSIVGFVVSEQHADVRFIEYFLRTAKARLEEFAPATAQKNINLETLQALAIPLPPLNEQHRIVSEVERRLSVVQAEEQVIEANLARAERLRQTILQRAFSGRLVAQYPNDEAAGVYIEVNEVGRGNDGEEKLGKNADQSPVQLKLL
jgi:type I restriction enzyme S subunit